MDSWDLTCAMLPRGAAKGDRTVGIIGTGKIGVIVTQIIQGFGCHLLAYDVYRNPEVEALGAKYVELPELFKNIERFSVISQYCRGTIISCPYGYFGINEGSYPLLMPLYS